MQRNQIILQKCISFLWFFKNEEGIHMIYLSPKSISVFKI